MPKKQGLSAQAYEELKPGQVGVYLPVATMVPVYLGGALRFLAEKWASSKEEADERRERGVLFASGLVGGEGLLGVVLAITTFVAVQYYDRDQTPGIIGTEWAGAAAPWLAAGLLALLIVGFWHLTCRRERAPGKDVEEDDR
ncbi:MAG: OPT/YSL family transporter [Thermoanaerobaculia bacterium]